MIVMMMIIIIIIIKSEECLTRVSRRMLGSHTLLGVKIFGTNQGCAPFWGMRPGGDSSRSAATRFRWVRRISKGMGICMYPQWGWGGVSWDYASSCIVSKLFVKISYAHTAKPIALSLYLFLKIFFVTGHHRSTLNFTYSNKLYNVHLMYVSIHLSVLHIFIIDIMIGFPKATPVVTLFVQSYFKQIKYF